MELSDQLKVKCECQRDPWTTFKETLISSSQRVVGAECRVL